MERIEVGRYENRETHEWDGWIHPEREDGEKVPAWVLFVKTSGHVVLGIREGGELQFSPGADLTPETDCV